MALPPHGRPPPRESPLSDAYLVRRAFWHDLAASVALGLLIGAVAFCFLSFVTHVTEAWMGADPGTKDLYTGFPNNRLGKDVSGFGKGPVWWLGITIGGGFVVGVVKWGIAYPQGSVPSFLQEIQHGHVDPSLGVRTAVGGLLSLACGASVGPEYPLSSFGGGAATWLAARLGWPPGRAQSLTLIGMSAALGSIFSTPYLAVLLIVELGGLHPSRAAEASILLLAAAAVSFSVYIGCVTTGLTYLGPDLGPGTAAQFTMGWGMSYMAVALPLGVCAGVLATLMLVLRGLLGRAITGLHARLGLTPTSAPSLIFLPALGGLVVGLLAVAAPLTIGNGSVPLSSVMADGYTAMWQRTRTGLVDAFCAEHDCLDPVLAEMAQLAADDSLHKAQYDASLLSGWPNPAPEDRVYPASLIAGTLFLKMVAWAASQAFGFIGGIIFPFLFVGACAGNLIAQLTGINQSFAAAVMTFAVPSSMVPLPLTCLAFGAFLVEASAYQTGAIFIAMITAHAVTTGAGVLHRVMGAPTLGAWLDDVPSFREPVEYGQKHDTEPPPEGPASEHRCCWRRSHAAGFSRLDIQGGSSDEHTRLLVTDARGTEGAPPALTAAAAAAFEHVSVLNLKGATFAVPAAAAAPYSVDVRAPLLQSGGEAQSLARMSIRAPASLAVPAESYLAIYEAPKPGALIVRRSDSGSSRSGADDARLSPVLVDATPNPEAPR